MIVNCPHCATGYRLPEQLLGERGSRVHCPACGGSFLLLRERGGVRVEPQPVAEARPASAGAVLAGAGAGAAPASDRAGPESPHAIEAPEEPGQVAAELLDSLASRLGGALGEARARGRVLAEFGPDMMRAFEEYRRRLGDGGAPGAFREAVRERWGVDLSAAPPPAGD